MLGLPQQAGQQLLGQCHSPAVWQPGSAGASVVHGGVRGGAGTATLLCASAAVSSGDCECQINRERLRCQASAAALLAVEEAVSHGAGPRCASRPSGRQMWIRAGEVGLLVEQGWVRSVLEHLTRSRSRVCQWEWAQRLHNRTGEVEFLGLVPAWCQRAVREAVRQLLCFSFYICKMPL